MEEVGPIIKDYQEKGIQAIVEELKKQSFSGEIELDQLNDSTGINKWTQLGVFLISKGKYRDAEFLYINLLRVLQELDSKKEAYRYHKGLPLHNLGVINYFQGNTQKALEYFREAYEEDKKSFGELAAEKMAAKIMITLTEAKENVQKLKIDNNTRQTLDESVDINAKQIIKTNYLITNPKNSNFEFNQPQKKGLIGQIKDILQITNLIIIIFSVLFGLVIGYIL